MILHGYVLTTREEPEEPERCITGYSVTQWIRDLDQALVEHPGKVFVRIYTDKRLLRKEYSALKNYKRNHADIRYDVRMKGNAVFVFGEEE